MSAEVTRYEISLFDNLSPGLRTAARNAQGLDRQMSRLDGGAKKSVQGLSSSVMGLAKTLGVAALAYKAFQFGADSIKATREFESLENAIVFASGSAEAGAQTMDYLRERSELLGTDLVASAEGFKTLSGALMGTKLEGQGTREVFDAIQVASSVMGLSAEDAKGAMLALGQMVGKGTVQAEELRGQLGERIPGAFKIAARSMNVTEQQLGKLMEQGLVRAEDFLPGFANELKKTFGPGLENSVESSQAKLNRFNNTMLDLKMSLGSALMPILNKIITKFKKIFSFFKDNSAKIKEGLQPFIDGLTEVWDLSVSIANELNDAFFGNATSSEKLDIISERMKSIGELTNALLIPFKGLLMFVRDLIKEFKNLYRDMELFANRTKSVFVGLGVFLRDLFSGIALSMNLDSPRKMKQGLKLIKGANAAGQNAAGAITSEFDKQRAFEDKQTRFRNLFKNATPGSGTTEKSFLEVLNESKAPGSLGAAAAAAGKGKKSSTSVDGVKSGRPTSVHININKLIETFNVSATNITDINNKAKDLVAQALLSAVNNVNNIAQ